MRKYYVVLAIVMVAVCACEPNGGSPYTNMNLTVRENTSAGAAMVPETGVARAFTEQFFIGLPRQDVFDTLGDPDVIFYGNDLTYTPGVDYDADAYHVYFDTGLSFRIFGPEVKEITLLNDDWIASNGLIVGMTLSQMLTILGDNYRLFETEFKDFYEYELYDISVEVYHGDAGQEDYVGEININEGNVG